MSEKPMQKNRADEPQLVQQAQQGNMEAFGELFDRWNEPLLRYLYHTLGNGQEAEDLAQDAFLRAYQRIEQLGPPWDFKSWLYRIATNLAMDHLERERRYINVEDTDEAVNMEMPSGSLPVERQVETLEQQHQVWKALGGLPTLYRQALILRELNGLSYEEIHVALDCSFENARQMVHRARLRFRDEYGFSVAVAAGMPRCRVLGDLLSAYRDGELGPQERRAVEQHLGSCPECRETRSQMGMIGALLLGLPAFKPSGGWMEKVRGRVRSEAAQGSGRRPVARGTGGTGGGAGFGGGRGGGGAGWALAGAGFGGLVLVTVVAAAIIFAGRFRDRFDGGLAILPTAARPTDSVPAPTGALAPLQTETATPSLTPTPAASLTPTPSETPTLLSGMQVVFTQNANCRRGPTSRYYIVTSMAQGAQAEADGRNSSSDWLDILVPGTRAHCWVLASTTDVGGAIERLPVLPPPPLPPPPAAFRHDADCPANVKKFAVRLTWSGVPGVSGYHLYRDGNLLETLRADATSYLDSHPPVGPDVTYQIDAFNVNGPSTQAETSVPGCK